MKTIRIFISSPCDVKEERGKAEQVIADLQQIYASQAYLQPILWEDLALPATASFQESIDYFLGQKPIEIAVFILWSRLGSPLGASITRPDGSAYRSGTERELDLMLAAFQQSGRVSPLILAYTRDDEATWKKSLSLCQRDQLEEMIAQHRLADSFIKEKFHDKDGFNLRAYHGYRDPVGFAQRLRTHLRSALDELLDADPAATRWTDAPYRSLEVFDIQHAPIFFGRSEEACDVMDRLRKQHDAGCGFVVIVGASGSGKSSLARAGVAASLLDHAYDEQVRAWRAGVYVPGFYGSDLISGLIKLLSNALPELHSSGADIADIVSSFKSEATITFKLTIAPALARAAEQAGGELRLLVVLDQMEELWTDRSITDKAREQFLEAIEVLARSGQIDVVATLRSDFYSEAQASPPFLRLKGEAGHFDLVAPGTAALQRMIVEPALLASVQFERDERTGKTLDQTILEDASCDASALPLLQYALAELYEQRKTSAELEAITENGTKIIERTTLESASALGSIKQLTFAAYQDMGGVEGAIGQRAAAIYARLPESTQAALNEILPLLITVDTENEQNAVRRRAPLAELTSTPDRQTLTQSLIAARFLATDRDGEQSVASLAHEALLRRWDALSQWVSNNRDHLRLRARIEQNQNRWDQANRDASLLLTPGLPLEEGRQLLTSARHFLTPSAAEYVEASISYQSAVGRRRTRQSNLVLSALSALTIVAIAGGVYSWSQRTVANQQTQVAIEQENLAKKRLAEQIEQAKEASSALLRFGLSEYRDFRLESGNDVLIRALRLRGEDDPLKVNYGHALSYGLTQGGRSWIVLWHEHPLRSAVFSPDGKRMATASWGNTARLWDAQTGTPLGEPMRHEASVLSVAFSPDGARVATASDDGTARIWDAHTGAPLDKPMQHESIVRSVFSPDGTRVATASWDKTARLWDAQTGAQLGEPMRHENTVLSVAFSPDGMRVVTGSQDKTARLWDAQSGAPLGEPMRHEDDVYSIAFSPDGTRVATGSHDKTARLWDAQTGELLGQPMRHEELVGDVTYSPDGTRVATASGSTARLWDAQTGAPLGEPMRHENGVSCIAFSPDGTRVATGSYDGKARLWDAQTGAPLGESMRHKGIVRSVIFSHDGTRLATASEDMTVRLWDAHMHEPLRENIPHDSSRVRFKNTYKSPDGTWQVIVQAGVSHLMPSNAQAGDPLIHELGHKDFVTCVAFSPDGKRVATGSVDKTARVWDTVTGAPLVEPMVHDSSIECVAFSPNGALLATGSFDYSAKVWDANTGELLSAPMQHEAKVMSLAFSPDGNRVATGSGDKKVRVWDALTGSPLIEPMSNLQSVESVSFNSDGTLLTTALSDNTSCIWDVDMILPRNIETLINRFVDKSNQSMDTEFQVDLAAFQTRRDLRVRKSITENSFGNKNWFAAEFHLPWLCEQEPQNERWRSMLTQAYAEQGKWSKALKVAVRAVELKPSAETYRAKLLISLASTDRIRCAQAANEYLAFAETSDASAVENDAAWNVGVSNDTEFPWGRVHFLANKAVARNEESPEYRETLGASLYRLSRYAEANKTLTMALKLFEVRKTKDSDTKSPIYGNYSTHAFLALTYHRLSEPDKSKEHRLILKQIESKSFATEWQERLRRRLLREEVELTCGVLN